uniref:Uncharacterized protein n=1 Tax=Opuntia streptacantha TaxID=393608 RepID=A0A7C9ER88_OPUST
MKPEILKQYSSYFVASIVDQMTTALTVTSSTTNMTIPNPCSDGWYCKALEYYLPNILVPINRLSHFRALSISKSAPLKAAFALFVKSALIGESSNIALF